jgi:putative transcriptional regulator
MNANPQNSTFANRTSRHAIKICKEQFFTSTPNPTQHPKDSIEPNKTDIHKRLIYLHQMQINMPRKAINRLKAVLAEQGKTNKWLAEMLSKNETTISRWCTNEVQPSVENLVEIAKLLEVDVKELINSTKSTK